jgi:SulP family sulfate permease
MAGLTVAAYLVPQVMAYSAIVGVPPVTGLWTALAAMLVYAVMGNSRVLSVGPEATISLLAGLAIAPLAHGDPARIIELGAGLSLVVAGWALVARMFRLGVIADLLSQPLLVGYLAGAAVLMVVGQLGKMTGTAVDGESIVEQVRSFAQVVADTDLPTLAVGLGSLAFIFVLHWLRPRWPASLIAVTAATIAYAALRLGRYGVAVVGDVPSGIPVPHVPDVSWPELKVLLVAGLGVTLMAYSDNMLFARAFPAPPLPDERPSDREVDAQSELVALGGAHVLVGLIGGFPVSSSGSRTALAVSARARSQMYSLVAAAVVVLMLFVAGPVMRYLPQASLGAVVFYAASKLVSFKQFGRLLRFRRRELILSLITLAGTVVYGILAGVGLAVALSLLEMGQRLARPHDAVLGRVPGLAGMHDVADYPNAETLPGLVIYRFDAPLFFANVGDLRRRVQIVVDKETEAYPTAPPRWLLLNVEANTEVDLTAADGLRELHDDLTAQGIRMGLVRIKRDLYEPLRRAGVIHLVGEDMLFPTLPVAEEAYILWAATHSATTAAAAAPDVPDGRTGADPAE